ncbi:MAG: hypothetical protein UY52_C0011G0012 [Parcubacteria group bacterium GW2011_GWC2_49_9]|nr:MAG: hypothetical protein UY52_C0011G0012 [Parcubacteria group bacterium GW2011_GWC2_49_9]
MLNILFPGQTTMAAMRLFSERDSFLDVRHAVSRNSLLDLTEEFDTIHSAPYCTPEYTKSSIIDFFPFLPYAEKENEFSRI